eukprot:gene16049-biopygen13561
MPSVSASCRVAPGRDRRDPFQRFPMLSRRSSDVSMVSGALERAAVPTFFRRLPDVLPTPSRRSSAVSPSSQVIGRTPRGRGRGRGRRGRADGGGEGGAARGGAGAEQVAALLRRERRRGV